MELSQGPAYPRYDDFEHCTTFLLSRRCLGRMFRLKPDHPTRKLFEYFLGLASETYKIDINAATVMSNHYHLVVSATSWDSDISGFMHCLNYNTASILNARQGTTGPLYEVKAFDQKALETEEDILDALAYVMCNPTEAGLVEDPEDWPGLITTHKDVGKKAKIAHRPKCFGKGSKKPKTTAFKISKPVALRNLPDKEYKRRLKSRFKAKLSKIHDKRNRARLGYLGAETVRRQPTNRTPDSPDVDRAQVAREERATSYKPHTRPRIESPYTLARKKFIEAYKEALTLAKAGEHAVFPYGTKKMVKTYGYPVEAKSFPTEVPGPQPQRE